MGPGSYEENCFICFVFLPDQQPIGLEMTFPTILIFAGKFMNFVFLLQRNIFSQTKNNIIQYFYSQMLLDTFFVIFTKLTGGNNCKLPTFLIWPTNRQHSWP